MNLPLEPSLSLAGQTVVVVGGSSGIGLGVAQAAAEADASVVIASSSKAKVEAAADSIPGRVLGLTVDVFDEASIAALFDQIEVVHHLAVTAKPGPNAPFEEQPLADAKRLLDGSFWSAYLCAREAGRKTPRDRTASMTFTSGGYAERPSAAYPLQTVAHLACEGLAKTLAVSLAPIRANAVRPGLVDTPIYQGMPDEARQAMFQAFREKAPAGAVGSSRDLAHAFLYLMTNPFVTGTVLEVDGGSHLV